MMRRARILAACVFVSGILWVVPTGLTQAQLNCRTQRCTVIPYAPVNPPEDIKNVNCYVNVQGDGQAYSESYAGVMYGQLSVGGGVDNMTGVMGYYYPCTPSPDCPGLKPVSGKALDSGDKVQNLFFFTKCRGGS
jgi:hypothetical protein